MEALDGVGEAVFRRVDWRFQQREIGETAELFRFRGTFLLKLAGSDAKMSQLR